MAELNFILFYFNPLFDGLTFNTSGHFAHCSYFTMQLAYAKPLNKVYLFCL